jgi:hypothetical protein
MPSATVCSRCYGKKIYYGKNLIIKNCDLCAIPDVKSDASAGLALELGNIVAVEEANPAQVKRKPGRPPKVKVLNVA